MKILGRIFLIAAGILLAVVAVPAIIDTVNFFNQAGWGQVVANQENIARFGAFLGHCVNAFLALLAFIRALIGRKSFLLALTAIILIIAPVSTVIGWVNSGTVIDPGMVFSLIGSFTAPILYFLGFLFI